jgi:ribA/ribD-fused uncharacterized protein
MADAIVSFSGDYQFLSNFYPRGFWWDHPLFDSKFALTAEHHFQAAKAATRADWERVHQARYAFIAKRLGRAIKKRDDWDEIRVAVMRSILQAKFADPILRAKLLATGEAELIEGNTWSDTFWGMVYTGPLGWVGDNHLGKLLMEIRKDIADGAVGSA